MVLGGASARITRNIDVETMNGGKNVSILHKYPIRKDTQEMI